MSGTAARYTAWDDVPDNEVVVVMVNQGGNAAVGVVLGVLGGLLFDFLEVEELPLKTQVQLVQDHLDLPRIAPKPINCQSCAESGAGRQLTIH